MSKIVSHHPLHKRYVASVTDTEEYIFVAIFDERTQKCFKTFELSSAEEMLLIILKYKSMLKVVFFDISTLESEEYENSYELLKAVKAFLGRHSISCHFHSPEYFLAFNMLVAADIIPYINDNYLFINVGFGELAMTINRYTINGYKQILSNVIKHESIENVANYLSQIMLKYNIMKMVLFSKYPNNRSLQNYANYFKSCNLFNFEHHRLVVIDSEKLTKTRDDTIIEMSNWFFNQNHVVFYCVPVIPETIEIVCCIGSFQRMVICAKQGRQFPFQRTAFVTKMVQQCLMVKDNGHKRETLEAYELDRKCHRYKITLTIDSEYFPKLEVEPIIIPEIQNLPKKLDRILKMKIPVIGFFEHSSVICVHQNGKYKFLDSWNGVYGNELLINFDQTHPKFGMDAINPNHTKMFHVVYDLIKIMSMPPENITENENWKFEITKDSDNPVLLEYIAHGGKKMTATPVTLMAMLLKEHLKLIKEEINVGDDGLKEIGFCFFDKMTKVEKKRVEKSLEESCKLIDTDCRFIELSKNYTFLKMGLGFIFVLCLIIYWYF